MRLKGIYYFRIRAHGLMIRMTGPGHNHVRRDPQAQRINYEGTTGGMRRQNGPFRDVLLVPFGAYEIHYMMRGIEAAKPPYFLKVVVHFLI